MVDWSTGSVHVTFIGYYNGSCMVIKDWISTCKVKEELTPGVTALVQVYIVTARTVKQGKYISYS